MNVPHDQMYTLCTMNRSHVFPRDFWFQALVQSDLSLRQLGALRRLDGLPTEDAVESGDNGPVNCVNAAAAVRPAMREVACATDMADAVDAADEVEALKSELEALKQQQQHPKEYADKGVPCSDDESDPVAQEVPQEVPTPALLDKDSNMCLVCWIF